MHATREALILTDWEAKLKELSKQKKSYKKWEHQRRVLIADAHDKGGLSHAQIAQILGDIKRNQVIRIVNSIRAERGQENG